MLGSAFHGPRFLPTSGRDFDVRDAKQVSAFLQTAAVSAVLHLAALTNLEHCEAEPRLAQEVNALGAKNLAVTCAHLKIPLIFISTSGVFGGCHKPAFDEDDTPLPQTIYAETKWLGEQNTRLHHPHSYIVRLPWVFGGVAKDKKFVGEFLRRIQNGQRSFQVVDDTLGSLLFNQDLAGEGSPLWPLLRSKRFGLYHAAQQGKASRFDIARAIVAAFQPTGTLDIRPVSSAQFNSDARVKRPTCEVLASRHLAALRPWQQALADYVSQWPQSPAIP